MRAPSGATVEREHLALVAGVPACDLAGQHGLAGPGQSAERREDVHRGDATQVAEAAEPVLAMQGC